MKFIVLFALAFLGIVPVGNATGGGNGPFLDVRRNTTIYCDDGTEKRRCDLGQGRCEPWMQKFCAYGPYS